MSRATSRARSSRPRGLSLVWRDAVWMLMSGHLHNAVDVDTGGHDVLRVQPARRHDLRHLGNGVLRGGGHDRAEVAGGLAVDEVSDAVGLKRLDEGNVGVDRRLEDLAAAVDDPGFLAL